VMSADVPNAFVQTQMPKPKKEKNEWLWKLQEC
jgi:hypothetical protein